MYLYSFWNILCIFWRLEAVNPHYYLYKHFLHHVLITNFEPILFFRALISFYSDSVKGKANTKPIPCF